MGLDMYLYRSVYIPHYEHNPEGFKLSQAVFKALGVNAERYKDSSLFVKLTAAYWRKANAIHGWFVHHVQNGVDNCGEYEVTREQLEDLRTLCVDVLKKDKSKEDDLPPVAGFFFGATDDDEWYRRDLQDTIKQLNRVLNEPNIGQYDSFIYHSSW